MFFDLEDLALLFKHHADRNIERLIGIGQLRIIRILHKTARILPISFGIDIRCHEIGIKILQQEELTGTIDHRLPFTRFIYNHQRSDILLFGYAVIVGTKGRRNVYDTGTILRSHIVTQNYPERIAHRLDPRNQRLILNTCQIGTNKFTGHLIWDIFSITVVPFKRQFCILFRKVVIEEIFGHHHRNRLCRIGIVCPNTEIVDLRTDSQSGIRRQGPRCSGPRHKIEITLYPFKHFFAFGVANHLELSRTGCIFHIPITARLVQLVVAEPRTGSRRIGLNGVSFVKQTFFIEFAQQIPQCLNIFVIIRDIRIVRIDPIAHFTGQLPPQIGIGHHFMTTGIVVLLDRNFRTDILFGDTEFLLDTQFDGQPVRIPSGLAMNEETTLRFVTTDYILNGTGHHMVNTRTAIGRGRSLIKHEGRMSFACRYTFPERIVGVPLFQNFLCDLGQIQPLVLAKFRTGHIIFEFTLYLSEKHLPTVTSKNRYFPLKTQINS